MADCPIPIRRYQQIVLGHGSGGRLSSELLSQVFLPAFANQIPLEDSATLSLSGRIAFTTDAFVVNPIFFPGGDIGRLAIHGTVNDLAVSGADPRYLAASFILEEGFPIADLERVVASMREACREAEVQLVTGDTKVVDRGKADKIFITTSGIGTVPEGRVLSIAAGRPGDQLLVSGTLGDHGIAILAAREGLELETNLKSDSAPLTGLVRALFAAVPAGAIRCLRDPTRGGLASSLHELAAASRVGVELDEPALPIKPEVRGACELLGLDPLYVANEGKLMAVVAPEYAERVLSAMRAHPLGRDANKVGTLLGAGHEGLVITRSVLGGERVVPLLEGEQLPRIC